MGSATDMTSLLSLQLTNPLGYVDNSSQPVSDSILQWLWQSLADRSKIVWPVEHNKDNDLIIKFYGIGDRKTS